MNLKTDVVVVGGGMAGLVSTVRALEQGAEVTLLEKGNRLGGTLPWTAGTIAVERGSEPVVDLYEPIEDGIEWLREKGITVRDPDDKWLTDDAERAGRFDPPDFIIQMEELIDEADGQVFTDTPFKRLKLDDQDAIAGVIAHNDERGTFEIDAPSVILATGGFSGNVDLLEQFLPSAELWNGRHPWNTGEGFIAARKIGAKTTKGLSKPLGGVRPAPPAQINEENHRSASTAYKNKAVIVNEAGRRFTDESKHISGSTDLVTEFLEHVDETGYIILDRDLYEDHTGQVAFTPNVGELLEGARDLGAPVFEAESLEELGSMLENEGVDGEQAVGTIEEFNRAMRNEAGAELDPPREGYRRTIETPPFYAIAVQPSIVYIRGGLDVNHNAQVVSQELSTTGLDYHPVDMNQVSLEPIVGLYATGIEIGRSEDHSFYHLGLSLGLASGRIAGKHAAEHAMERREQVIEQD